MLGEPEVAMTDSVDFEAAHRKFAVECFNLSWKLIGKAERSPAEDITLVALAQASLWHWMQRPDCADRNLSIAHWLLARVYCVTCRPEEALRYATRSLEFAQRPEVPLFALAYAHEACARAAALQGSTETVQAHMGQARALAERLDANDRKRLLDDLATIPLVDPTNVAVAPAG
jgi:hypothetical protein